jgi:SAM-dependent methyltransferase
LDKDLWAQGIDTEIGFWSRWLETKGGQWPWDYANRTDPRLELQQDLARLLKDFKGETPKVLDVGAGPMTFIGKIFRGRPINLVAVDALAALYDQLDFPSGLPLIRTQNCDAEMLSQEFGTDVFDLTYSRNALDHTYDPVKAFREMVAVTKPHGIIFTDHLPREATSENWSGFHQWDFFVEDSSFYISNKSEKFNLNCLLGDDVEFLSLQESPTVKSVMRKRKPSQ